MHVSVHTHTNNTTRQHTSTHTHTHTHTQTHQIQTQSGFTSDPFGSGADPFGTAPASDGFGSFQSSFGSDPFGSTPAPAKPTNPANDLAGLFDAPISAPVQGGTSFGNFQSAPAAVPMGFAQDP